MVYLVSDDIGDALQLRQIPSLEFTRFVNEIEPRLSRVFFARYGPEVGSEVTADSLAYAWEHWDRVRQMANPAGYLFRVGQSKARWYHRPRVSFPAQEITETRDVEPDLHRALARLTKNQRTAVVLIYALDWTEEEVAELVGKSRSTVRTHLERGLARLRDALEVKVDV